MRTFRIEVEVHHEEDGPGYRRRLHYAEQFELAGWDVEQVIASARGAVAMMLRDLVGAEHVKVTCCDEVLRRTG